MSILFLRLSVSRIICIDSCWCQFVGALFFHTFSTNHWTLFTFKYHLFSTVSLGEAFEYLNATE